MTTSTGTTITPGTTINCNDVNEPGTYICNWSGHLMRVWPTAFNTTGNASFGFQGTGDNFNFTFVNSNPDYEITEARSCATEWGINTSF